MIDYSVIKSNYWIFETPNTLNRLLCFSRSSSHMDNRYHHHHRPSGHGSGDIHHRTRRKSSRIEDDRPRFCGIPCAQETADTLQEMLDFSLLRDPVFILYIVSNFLTSIGFNVPYVYIVVSGWREQKSIFAVRQH